MIERFPKKEENHQNLILEMISLKIAVFFGYASPKTVVDPMRMVILAKFSLKKGRMKVKIFALMITMINHGIVVGRRNIWDLERKQITCRGVNGCWIAGGKSYFLAYFLFQINPPFIYIFMFCRNKNWPRGVLSPDAQNMFTIFLVVQAKAK